jgi:hypothetical protein
MIACCLADDGMTTLLLLEACCTMHVACRMLYAMGRRWVGDGSAMDRRMSVARFCSACCMLHPCFLQCFL